MPYSDKKKWCLKYYSISVLIHSTSPHMLGYLYFRRARLLSLGTAMQPTITICCVGSLFPLLKGTDSLAWPEKQNSVLYTQKEVLKVLFRIRLKNEILCRKIQQRNLRIAQNLGHWWPTFPLHPKHHSPLVSPLAAKELWPLGYRLLQTKIYVLSLLSKSQPFCTGDMVLTSHFLRKIFFSWYSVRLNISNYSSWLVDYLLSFKKSSQLPLRDSQITTDLIPPPLCKHPHSVVSGSCTCGELKSCTC